MANIKNYEFKLSDASGASLVELCIILPFLLLLLAGVLNIASFLSQMQAMSEAVRHGARTAATRSNDGISCDAVVEHAYEVASAYRRQYTGHPTSSLEERGSSIEEAWWKEPEVCLSKLSWDGLEQRYVNVSISTAGPKNCMFCYLNVLSYIPLTLRSSFKLEWGSCLGTSYAPIEGAVGSQVCRS